MSTPPLSVMGEHLDSVSAWTPERDDPDGVFRYVDLSAVDQHAKVVLGARELACAEAPSRARQLIRACDVLVSTVRPNLNGVALVPSELDGATASTGFCVLRPRASQLDARYLYQWVKSPRFVSDMVRKATGASYPAVSDRIVCESKLPLPPLPEQRRIAEILDKADALRAKRRAALVQLETLTQAAFFEAYSNTCGPSRVFRLSELAESAKGSFVNGPFGSNLLTTELRNEGIPVIYIRDIRSGEYRRVSKSFVTERKSRELAVCRVISGDVLVAKVGDPPGISAVYPNGESPAIVTQDVIRIRVARDVASPEFVVGYLNSPFGKRKIAEITMQATRARFSLGDFKALEIVLPPIESQLAFARRIAAIDAVRSTYRASVASLDALFVSLQHRAFRGDL